MDVTAEEAAAICPESQRQPGASRLATDEERAHRAEAIAELKARVTAGRLQLAEWLATPNTSSIRNSHSKTPVTYKQGKVGSSGEAVSGVLVLAGAQCPVHGCTNTTHYQNRSGGPLKKCFRHHFVEAGNPDAFQPAYDTWINGEVCYFYCFEHFVCVCNKMR